MLNTHWILAIGILAGGFSAASPAAPSALVGAAEIDHSALDQLLRSQVRDGRVDYLAIRKSAWGELEAYLERMSQVDLGGASEDERLAFYMNVYNASMIRAAIVRYRDVPDGTWDFFGYDSKTTQWEVFDAPTVKIGSERVSLNEFKSRVLAEIDEPRIHVGLVCGAQSCPPILARAFVGDDVRSTLDASMRAFLNDSSRNRVDTRKRELQLSQIFNWYSGEFGSPPEVAKYADRYIQADVAGFEVSFLEYDWALNIAKPRSGDWMRTKGDSTRLFRSPGSDEIRSVEVGSVFERIGKEGKWVEVDLGYGKGSAWIEARRLEPAVFR